MDTNTKKPISKGTREKILLRLISVKSLVTLAMTGAFIVLTFRGVIEGDKFNIVFNTIMAFYFGTQAMKDDKPSAPAEEEGEIR